MAWDGVREEELDVVMLYRDGPEGGPVPFCSVEGDVVNTRN